MKRRYRTPAKKCINAFLYRLDIIEFSTHVDEVIIKDAHSRRGELLARHAGSNASLPPFVLATCVFLPTYFVNLVKDHWPKAERLGHVEKGSFDRFIKLAHSIRTPQPSDQQVAELDAYKSSFQQVAARIFPHFLSLQDHGKDVVRICLFSRDLDKSVGPSLNTDADEEYFRAFERAHAKSPLDVYLFFRWLNGRNRCWVALPSSWEALGLNEPRDFAVFNDELLVEFHRDERIYIQVEPHRKKACGSRMWGSSWKFCDLQRFSRAVLKAGTAAIDLLPPEQFVNLVFFEKSRLEGRVLREVRHLQTYFHNNLQRDSGANRKAEENLRELKAVEDRIASLGKQSLLDIVERCEEPSTFGQARGIVAKLRKIIATGLK